jgi:putative PIN family toxin of toxin-antitoxin system
VITWELAEELLSVVRRPKFRRYGITGEDVLALLVVLGAFLPSIEVGAPVRDPKDAPVVAAALVGKAEAIVTGDQGLLDDEELRDWLRERGIELLSPAALLLRLT